MDLERLRHGPPLSLDERVAQLEANTWDPFRYFYVARGSTATAGYISLALRAVAFLVKCAAMYWIGRALWRLVD